MSTSTRRTHARSRMGCATCKERHVRCDERLPYCRNCIRLGRECSYVESRIASPSSSEDYYETGSGFGLVTDGDEPEAAYSSTAYPVASQQAWFARNAPSDFNIAPTQDLSDEDVDVVLESQEMLLQQPMLRSILMTIAQQYLPKYNMLAPQFACMKHAIVSLGGYTHFRATRSSVSESVYVRHTGLALSALQQEIENFGPCNSDAVVTSSILMSASAENWEQWAVFVDGYSNALTQIIDNNLRTSYPDLLGDVLQLRQCSWNSDPDAAPLYGDNQTMRQHVSKSINSMVNISNLIGLPKWRTAGFEELERLARSVTDALSVPDEIEQFHQLALLRTWLFWIELRKTNDVLEQSLLTAHFYGLVLAVLPLFPARYATTLAGICQEKVRAAQKMLGRDKHDDYGLGRLLALAQSCQ